MTILAVETSCDETAAAVIERADGADTATITTSVVASQIDLHQKYGGVYPEVASREHTKQILPVISEALQLPLTEKGRLPDLDLSGIDYLAITHGPGLIGALLVGTQTMASLSFTTKIPLLPVNHLAGHIYASFLNTETPPQFPLMAMVVSGGHTMLLYMEKHHHYQLLGQTRDDAAGEAFDKVAKLLNLPYPGGPQISRLHGDRNAYDFPIGLEHEPGYDFSFSGLKTAVLRQIEIESQPITNQTKANIAASFERAVIEALLLKTSRALDDFPVRHFVLGGGVAANVFLRDRLASLLRFRSPSITLHVPPHNLCTDNAAVIGAAAAFSDLKPISPLQLQTFARLPLHTV